MIGHQFVLAEEQYTLKVGCIPGEVEFEKPEAMITSIDLMAGYFDPVGFYTIPSLVQNPPHIVCPVKQYEIIPSIDSPGSYRQCERPLINPKLAGSSQTLPIMVAQQRTCTEEDL